MRCASREAEFWKKILATRALPYLRQIAWREFAHHLLHHFPHTAEKPLRDPFARFPWRRSRKELSAWRRGLTGYPFVDAGMRELRRPGGC
ncbi:MAG: FAD-binding domain-containing protein, partial [Candidatus Eisenbacteria bacterium]